MTIDLFTSEDRYLPWITTAPVFTIPTTLGVAHARVTLAMHRSPNLRTGWRIIATQQLDSLTLPSTPYVFNNCIYFYSHLLAGTNSIAIDIMAMKDYFFSASDPNNPPLLPVGALCCRWLRNDFSIPRAPENMSHKNIVMIHFHIWTWYTPTNVISRACHRFSIQI